MPDTIDREFALWERATSGKSVQWHSIPKENRMLISELLQMLLVKSAHGTHSFPVVWGLQNCTLESVLSIGKFGEVDDLCYFLVSISYQSEDVL